MKDCANVLSRDSTFLMGILKKMMSVEAAPIEQNSTIKISTPNASTDNTDGTSMGRSLSQMGRSLSQMGRSFSHLNCRDTQQTVELVKSSRDAVPGSKLHSISLENGPLSREAVISTYADVFHGLGKFPGDPYKLRLKPNSIPAKQTQKGTSTSPGGIPRRSQAIGRNRCIRTSHRANWMG